MEENEIDITPTPELLIALKRAKITWQSAIGELIDNAFDAGALIVSIEFGPGRKLRVSDDGNGCTNLPAMLTLGSHHRQSTTRLGRYGVGLKDAACWLWGKTDILTTAGDTTRRIHVDWGRLSKQKQWKLPNMIESPSNGRKGTSITFADIDRGLPHDYEYLANELSYTFTPGLLRGYQIQIRFPRRKPIVATPYNLPPLSDVVDDEFDVDGKRVRLHAGLVKEGHDNPKAGFAYCHHHRVIIGPTALGAGDFSIKRFAGQVFIGDDWQLSAHKDDISERKDELAEAVLSRCKPLLEKARAQARTVTSELLTDRLNQRLRQALASLAKTKKAKRDPAENKTGTVEPKGTEKKHKQAKRTQPGNRMLSDEQIGKLMIDWKDCGQHVLGEVDSEGARIWMNESNQYVASLRDAENDDAILTAAIGMYVNKAVESANPQRFLPGMRVAGGIDFVPAWSEVLASIYVSNDTKE